jgi:hypothetical protein
MRYGLVAISQGAQTNPLELWFDRAYMGTTELGPLSAPAVAPTGPSISIVSPQDGTTLKYPTPILTAISGITPVKVRFFVDGDWIGYSTSSPWSITWDPNGLYGVSPGLHSLTARAFDAAGNTVTSAPVVVDVEQPPMVSITAPANGTTVSQPITISATFANVVPQRIRFYIDGQWIGYAQYPPWSITWDPYGAYGVGPGQHVLTAKLFDWNWNAYASAPVQITVPSPLTIP